MLLSTCDGTCRRECTRCCDFVGGDPTLAAPEAPFLQRENIDHCFTRVIATRKGLVNGMTRVVSAAEWHAAKAEHVGATPALVVRGHHVEAALALERKNDIALGGTANPASDLHKGLKDVLSDASQLTCARHVCGHRDDWRSSGLNFTLGTQGAIRGGSPNEFM
jgi:hypothetical protein